MAFQLSVYPWIYKAKYHPQGGWSEKFQEKAHHSPAEEAALDPQVRQELLAQRNADTELPIVNYTTQYGMGCFEGLKAFPQKAGGLKLFRPDQNAKRMARSMEGLMMPACPEELFLKGVTGIVQRNADLGFAPEYNPDWETDHFLSAHAVYVRPFSYSEGAIGLGLSESPWVVMVATPVGSYFKPGARTAVTTERIRATRRGTGWIKCSSNYVISTLAKKEAEAQGYMEAVFLDAREGRYVEEGSSCNIFFLMKSGTLVTPELGDTILPGITRDSILQLARDRGIPCEERRIAIDDVLDNAQECFVTGTAAGITPLDSLTHQGKTTEFRGGGEEALGVQLLHELKGLQYGLVEDRHGWMYSIN